VVWEDEHVPAGFSESQGVLAGGTFHPLAGTRAAEAS